MEARATSEALPPSVEEDRATQGAAADPEEPKKGGRFSRKKDKKKAAKKAKKSAKHSKDQENQETAAPTDGAGPFPDTDVQVPHGQVPGEGVASVAQSNLQVGTDAASRPEQPESADHVRRDSGIADVPPGHATDAKSRSSPRDQQGDGEGGAEERGGGRGGRSKSRSRSGSRKRFGLFRRRGRSSGRDDRSKSETDLPGVAVGNEGEVATGDDGLSDQAKGKGTSRYSHSLDRGKGHQAAASSRRGDGDAARPQSASLERDAYLRFNPATAPRTRLQYMTVKDAVSEYRHRRNTSASRMSSAERRRAEDRRARSMSNTDVSRSGGGGVQGGEGADDIDNHPDRHPQGAAGTVRETSLLGESSDRLDEVDAQQGEGATAGRRNLGEQIQDMCRTYNRDGDAVEGDGGVGGSGGGDEGGSRRRGEVSDLLPRNSSTVIFINPNDIVMEPTVASPSLPPDGSSDKSANQSVVKPSNLFMELRRAVPLYSNSTAARERRISQSEDTFVVPRDSRTSHSRDSLIPREVSPHGISPATSTTPSKGASSDTPFHNIPVPGGAKDLTGAPSSPSSAVSPTITVNCDEGAGMSDSMDTSLTMTTSMMSSTDSGKPSSDQGFTSEPRESDSESESADMSGFSTPPEEPDDRGSMSPAVFVNTVSNRLEVPSSRGGSGSSRKAEHGAPPFSRSESSKSDSVLLKQKGKRSPLPSSTEGSVLYQQTKQELRPSSSDEADRQSLKDRMDQKTVPVMGTSVQHKYRRTFSPVRKKGGDASQEATNDSATEGKGAATDGSKQSEGLLTPDDAWGKGAPNESDQEAGKSAKQGEEPARRGRDPKKRRGFISSRSFRRKNEKENREPDEVRATEKVDPAAETPGPGDEQRPPDDDAEELRYRRGFQDKSIQTSESLLLDLIKKTKKRKTGFFSPNGRKSKQPRTTVEYSIPISQPPPPKYEEERPLGREAPMEASTTFGFHGAPLPSAIDQVEGEEERDGQSHPQAVPVVPVTSEPAEQEVQQQQQQPGEDTETKKAARKSKGPSLLAIVALKQKLARNRKKKEQRKKEEQPQDDLPSDTLITIENELNLSKLAEIKETDILDDDFFEPDLCPALPLKKIRFEPIASDEPIQSEEPLPPLSPASRRISARRNSTRGRERRKKCLQYIKKFVAFLFSHIGLCSLVVGYTIVGGLMFRELERHHERQIKVDIKTERLRLMNQIVSLATGFQLNELSEKNMTDALTNALVNYQIFLHKETASNGWDGKEIDPNSTTQHDQWSFASSMLYAITVMTTIGYGHVTPKTSQGRLVTIGYAVLGIPLTLLCLTNIGDVMASGFRLLYGKVCCGVCCKLFKPSRRRRRRGPGDVEAGLARQEHGETDKPKEVIQVPTSLCLLLIASYIFAGSVLFVFWEGWDFVTGSYFCFITLSTIGFGDIVPGMDLNTWSKESKLALSGLYLVFGLSLIAMCFNLVQEDVKAKCRWIGMKIGIIEKPEPPV